MLLTRFVFIIFITISQVCYADHPANRDIELEVRSILSNCNSLKIKSVEKINGLKIDDINHQVLFDIEVVSTPLGENIELWKKMLPDRDEIEHSYHSYKSKLEELSKAISNLEEHLGLQNKNNEEQRAEVDAKKKEYYEYKKNSEKIVADYHKLDSKKRYIKDKLAKPFLDQCDYKNSWVGLSLLNNIFGDPENHTKEIIASLEVRSVMTRYDNGWGFSSNFQNTRVLLKHAIALEENNSEFEAFAELISQPSVFLDECIRIDKTIAIEQGGLSEFEANERASSDCKEQLSNILDCIGGNNLKICYENYYQVEGQ